MTSNLFPALPNPGAVGVNTSGDVIAASTAENSSGDGMLSTQLDTESLSSAFPITYELQLSSSCSGGQMQHEYNEQDLNLKVEKLMEPLMSLEEKIKKPLEPLRKLYFSMPFIDDEELFNYVEDPDLPPEIALFQSQPELTVEGIIPGIFLTKNFIPWNEENLSAHGFTHIVVIDKHKQAHFLPRPPIFKLLETTIEPVAVTNTAFDCDYYGDSELYEKNENSEQDQLISEKDLDSPGEAAAILPESVGDVLSTDSESSENSSMTDECSIKSRLSKLSFGRSFEAIELNFGDKTYVTTVLPNCYRAVKFINKARNSGGTVLIIDCDGNEQKCLTIIVAFLMFKHNINFDTAFSRLKEFYSKAELDRFYVSQLYEYEPILRVQREQSRGHSCSRELNAALLKRKKREFEEMTQLDDAEVDALFDTLTPLSHFKLTPSQEEQQKREEEYLERIQREQEELEAQQQELLTSKYQNPDEDEGGNNVPHDQELWDEDFEME